MSNDLVKYGESYALSSYEVLFIQSFKDTHSISKSLKLLTKTQQERVNASLRTGKSDLSKAFKSFVEEAPIHPEANKVVILDNLIWIMNQAKEDQDTQGVLRAISEINKMIKGNLVSSNESKVIEKHFVGVIDLTKKEEKKEPITIDVTKKIN
jgi:hypothetical protein